jgi:hypothetical protein
MAAVLPPEKARAVPRDRRRKRRLGKLRALPRNRRRKNRAAREEKLRKNRPRKRRAARKRNASFDDHPQHCSGKEARYFWAFLFWVSNAARSSFICPQRGPHRQDRLIDLGKYSSCRQCLIGWACPRILPSRFSGTRVRWRKICSCRRSFSFGAGISSPSCPSRYKFILPCEHKCIVSFHYKSIVRCHRKYIPHILL